MTTPTTSRVSDAMVNAAGQVFLDYDHFVPPTLLERALEAALASQGDVVAVCEIQALPRFYIFSDCAHNGTSWLEVTNEVEGDWLRWSDLSTILNRGGK